MKTDKIIAKIALPVIALAAVLILLVIYASSSKNTGEQNNAYIRVNNCIVSYNAVQRTQGDIENCYRRVESDLNTQIKRYDNSSKQL